MTDFQPTLQQQDVIDAFATRKDVTISAGAGCGKSTTLELLARSVPSTQKGLLIAFNRAVADDAAKKLNGTSTTALNTHRIAYAWARQDKLGKVILDKMNTSTRVSRYQIARSFRVQDFIYRNDAHAVKLNRSTMTDLAMRTLSHFLKDASAEISASHTPYVPGLESPGFEGKGAGHHELNAKLIPLAKSMWEDICSPRGNAMTVSHDAYLKLWAASKPELPYDFILLDEAQDTNPAVMSVFESQLVQKVAVGDANQQLFAWNGSLNAMSKFSSDIRVKLTQSWRFGLAIQDAANVFLDMLNADIRLEGNPRVNSKIIPGAPFDPTLSASVLTRTNAGAIQELMNALNSGQTAHLIGGSKGFASLIKAAEQLQQNQPVTHPDFVGFSNWNEVEAYVEEDTPESMDLGVIVRLVKTHGTRSLLKALEQSTVKESDAQTVISTVHKVKGREWDQVRIAEDFIRKEKNKDDSERKVSSEDLMLYYVAVTRAKTLLDPGSLGSFLTNVKANTVQEAVNKTSQVVPIENRLAIQLDDSLRAQLQSRFSSREDAEAFLLETLKNNL